MTGAVGSSAEAAAAIGTRGATSAAATRGRPGATWAVEAAGRERREAAEASAPAQATTG